MTDSDKDLKLLIERNERAIEYIEKVVVPHLKGTNQRQIEDDLKIVVMILKGE